MIAASEDRNDNQDYWQTELRSLGIEPKRKNELNDKEELEALVDNLKLVFYQDYKSDYGEDGIHETHFDHIV